jgi:Fe-S-cluster containining protein
MNRRERRAAAAGGRKGTETTARANAHPMQARAEELYAQVVEAERRLGAETLARVGRTGAALRELVDGAATLGDSFMQRSPTDPASLACRRGCDHCCHRPVGTNAASVLRIAVALRASLSEADFAEVLSRVVALDEKTHGKTWTPTERPPHACAFLVEGGCSIYPVRPFVCRAWNSADASACKRALGQDSVEMRFDLYQRTVFAGVEQGLKTALQSAALDGADLELTAAMRVAMQTPDACERWLAGEAVFAGCEAKRPAEGARRRLPFA